MEKCTYSIDRQHLRPVFNKLENKLPAFFNADSRWRLVEMLTKTGETSETLTLSIKQWDITTSINEYNEIEVNVYRVKVGGNKVCVYKKLATIRPNETDEVKIYLNTLLLEECISASKVYKLVKSYDLIPDSIKATIVDMYYSEESAELRLILTNDIIIRLPTVTAMIIRVELKHPKVFTFSITQKNLHALDILLLAHL